MKTKTDKQIPSIQFLTDEVISLMSENNILTEYRDIDLSYTTMLRPYPKGVVDKRIFGSMFSNQCNCGRVTAINVPCPKCGSTILDSTSAFRRYARIESPVYYCTELKYKQLLPWLRRNFRFTFNIRSEWLKSTKLTEDILEVCQFIYHKEDDIIEVTDDIDNFFECSFEGLLQIMIKNFPNKVNTFSSHINTSVLVVPIIMRPPFYSIMNGNRILEMNSISVAYQNIIYAIHVHYNDNFSSIKSEADKSLFRATLRRLISKSLSNLSGLLRPSKQNVARNMQSNRLSNSGRCTIIPAPDLKVDEVYIPRHLMYEACREEFIEFLMEEYGCSFEKAELTYKLESNNSEVQKLFERYVEGDGDKDKGKYAIINRNPTLDKLNMMSCKVRLTNDYTMGIPLLLCAPFSGDFDGDTMSFYVIPKKSNEFINEEMNPKNLVYYKKNMSPLFMPSHEIMAGLIAATKCIQTDNPLTFDTVEDALEYRKTSRDLKYQTVFLMGGTRTTLAREILSDYFDTNLNAYLNGFDVGLDSKNLIPLYSKLSDKEDRLERIQKIQEFSLLITTMSGATAPLLSQLYVNVDTTRLDRIKAIESDDILSTREKEVKIREIYEGFVKEESSKVDQTVRVNIEESSRAKVQQLLSVSLPQLNVGPEGNAYVSKSTLINGMNPRDYVHHSIENRAIQDIKQLSVPNSGNFTRLMTYAASPYYYSSEKDEKNKGILIKEKDAWGRTRVDGTIVNKTSSEKMIRVRSLITTTTPQKTVVTSDMISNLVRYKEGSFIGIEMITSLTRDLTQSGLSLKHGGSLFNFDPLSKIIAPEGVTASLIDDWIILKGRTKIYKYPKPAEFVLNYSPNNRYKKGDTVGVVYVTFTPSYKLDSAIRLCEARAVTSKKRFASNNLIISECFAYDEGVITYKASSTGMKVFVGNTEYDYCSDAVYFLPEGTKVKKYDRICTGVLDIRRTVERLNDYEESFYLFRTQFNELLTVNSELIELLYSIIVKRVNSRLSVKRILNVIHDSKSVYTTLSFEDPKKTFNKITSKGVPFVEDTMTSVLLSLITNNKIK